MVNGVCWCNRRFLCPCKHRLWMWSLRFEHDCGGYVLSGLAQVKIRIQRDDCADARYGYACQIHCSAQLKTRGRVHRAGAQTGLHSHIAVTSAASGMAAGFLHTLCGPDHLAVRPYLNTLDAMGSTKPVLGRSAGASLQTVCTWTDGAHNIYRRSHPLP